MFAAAKNHALFFCVVDRDVRVAAEDAQRRSVFSASRDAVRLATQPFSNVSRALQMSSTSPITLTPTASICATGEPASFRTMSMSWIIMSSTTPTSMLRNVSGLMRMTSMKRGCDARAAHRADGRVEPLDVPDLHDGAVLLAPGRRSAAPRRRPWPAASRSGRRRRAAGTARRDATWCAVGTAMVTA